MTKISKNMTLNALNDTNISLQVVFSYCISYERDEGIAVSIIGGLLL